MSRFKYAAVSAPVLILMACTDQPTAPSSAVEHRSFATGASANLTSDNRLVQITGTYTKTWFYPMSFGSTSATLPLSMTAVIDFALGNTYPAGTVVHNGATSLNALTVFTTGAVRSLTATLGNVSWNEADIISLSANAFTWAFLVEGDIEAGSGQSISVRLANTNGEVHTSYLSCGTQCSLTSIGAAYDNLNGSDGLITGLSVVIQSPADLMVSLQHDVELLGLNAAVLDAAAAKIEAQNGNKSSAINLLSAFIKQIEAQRGLKLTSAQADDFIARANAIIALL